MANFSDRDRILRLVQDTGRMTSGQVAEALDLPRTMVRYHLDTLRKNGQLKSLGRGAGGGYAPVRSTRRNGFDTDVEILNVLRAAEGEALTTNEIATELDMSYASVKNRLYGLQKRGLVIGERTGDLRGYRIVEQSDVESLDRFAEDVSSSTAVDDENVTEYTEERRNEKIMNLVRDLGEDLFDSQQLSTILGHHVSAVEDASTVPGIGVITQTEQKSPERISVPVELLPRVKNLPFAVGVAVMALLSNDTVTAKKMLELS